MQFPLHAQLKDGTRIRLVPVNERDIESLRRLYRVIVDEGTSYPHNQFPDDEEFQDYWIRGKTTVVVYLADRGHEERVLGAFYLKPNWPGACPARGKCRLYRRAGMARQGVGSSTRRHHVTTCQGSRLSERAFQLGLFGKHHGAAAMAETGVSRVRYYSRCGPEK